MWYCLSDPLMNTIKTGIHEIDFFALYCVLMCFTYCAIYIYYYVININKCKLTTKCID